MVCPGTNLPPAIAVTVNVLDLLATVPTTPVTDGTLKVYEVVLFTDAIVVPGMTPYPESAWPTLRLESSGDSIVSVAGEEAEMVVDAAGELWLRL